MITKKRQNGFVLLLVIAMIPLIGMVIAIMTANSKALMFQTHSAELQVRAENACRSGLAWVRQNPAKANALTPENPLILTLDKIPKIHCFVERTGEKTFQITGDAEEGRHSAHCRRQGKK